MRPSVYKPEYIEELDQLMTEGKLDYAIAAHWGISKRTLSRWKTENPEFNEAYERALPKCEEWWSKWGEMGMQGLIKGFNFMAWQSFMNNKFGWANKNDQGAQINIGNVNLLSTKSNAELTELLNQRLSNLSRYQEVKCIDIDPKLK